MDSNKALKYRAIIRIVCCVFALGAAVTAFIFRLNLSTGACLISRICAIAMFVCMVGATVLAFATKTFSPKFDGVGLVIALVGFIGNFLVAPGSSLISLAVYALTHTSATQLEVGSYMVMAAGIFMISYTVKAIKSGN